MQDETTDDPIQGIEDAEAQGATTTEAFAEVDADGQEQSEDQATSTALDRKLTRENASLRKRLRELEAMQKEREEAELSEQERLQKRVMELQAQVDETAGKARQIRLRAEVTEHATTLGIVDIDAAYRLLDTSTLTYDDDADCWIGVDDALRALTHDKPWLVSSAQPAGAGSNPTNPPRRRARLTKEALSKMSTAEIDALPWEDVQAALAE